MNLAEFKAWFDGFTENLDGPPGPKAWQRICARVSEIKDAPPVERHHFHDYYHRTWPQYPGYLHSFGGIAQLCSSGSASQLDATGIAHLPQNSVEVKFDSSAAFSELGRADAADVHSFTP